MEDQDIVMEEQGDEEDLFPNPSKSTPTAASNFSFWVPTSSEPAVAGVFSQNDEVETGTSGKIDGTTVGNAPNQKVNKTCQSRVMYVLTWAAACCSADGLHLGAVVFKPFEPGQVDHCAPLASGWEVPGHARSKTCCGKPHGNYGKVASSCSKISIVRHLLAQNK